MGTKATRLEDALEPKSLWHPPGWIVAVCESAVEILELLGGVDFPKGLCLLAEGACEPESCAYRHKPGVTVRRRARMPLDYILAGCLHTCLLSTEHLFGVGDVADPVLSPHCALFVARP